MWSNYLLTLYRTLTRRRLYAALNLLGLSVGIAVFLVLFLDVRFETGFERWIPGADQIYLVRTTWVGPWNGEPSNDASPGALWEELKGDHLDLTGTRLWYAGGIVRDEAHVAPANIQLVDPSFFDVFDLPLAAGDRASLLKSPDEVVLTQSRARERFGDQNPIGRRLTLVFGGRTHEFRVAGVLKDPPRSTDLELDYLVPLRAPSPTEDPGWSSWVTLRMSTYLRFKSPAAAAALDADLPRFADRHASADIPPPAHTRVRLALEPLLDMHLRNPKDEATVAAIGLVGLLTLLLAAVNYVNLATAGAGLRAKEVAVRKVLGASGSALVAQYMGEALITAAAGALVGLGLCEIAVPLVNATGGLSLRIAYFGADGVAPVLLLVTVIIGFGAGIWPALVLSRFRPAAVLASARTPGGGRAGGRLREALVVLQFAVAIAFTIATGVILAQTRYLRQADLGYQRDGLIVVKSFESDQLTAAQRASLLEAWRALPGVRGAAQADIAPGDDSSRWAYETRRAGTTGEGPGIDYVHVGPGFFETYGARLIAGRLADPAHGGDFTPPELVGAPLMTSTAPQSVVLNESAVRKFGFASPQAAVGRQLICVLDDRAERPLTVIGVVQDFRFRTPHRPVAPTAYTAMLGDISSSSAGVRYAGGDPRPVMAALEASWRRLAPGIPFHAATADHELAYYYRADDQHGRLFTFGAVLAVVIGCVGLYGLAAFSAARRTREIGVRKTLGASTGEVLGLLIGQLLRPVLIANLIAWPLAFWTMRTWLSGFDQRIGLSPVYFLAAAALTALIALLTVAAHALRVALAEPARALAHE